MNKFYVLAVVSMLSYYTPCIIYAQHHSSLSSMFAGHIENFLTIASHTAEAQQQYIRDSTTAYQFAQNHSLAQTFQHSSTVATLHSIVNGIPLYIIGSKSIASAQTIRTASLWQANSQRTALNGNGQIVGLWDEGRARSTHREFTNKRVIFSDNSQTVSNHSTHVAGTMISAGIGSSARGMASAAQLHTYDWTNDITEMRQAANYGLRLSNHSYGFATGWVYNLRQDNLWAWVGDASINNTMDYRFGYYSAISQAWDKIANDYPYYILCKSAGNERGEGPRTGEQHWVLSNGSWVLSTTPRNKDGGDTGYDCIEGSGLSKNVITVGAISPMTTYSSPSSVVMSTFSGWGPTDDGRIKPDIVAQGVNVLSTSSQSDSGYAVMNGTSMATPSVTASIALLLQHQANVSPRSTDLLASTIKALLIHTADEAGEFPGPDYTFGWGVMNTQKATELLSLNAQRQKPWNIIEPQIKQGQRITLYGSTVAINTKQNSPIKITVSWNDPAGITLPATHNASVTMLRNDIDIQLVEESTSKVFYPWVLNPGLPKKPASRGNNTRDNVEQIFIDAPTSGRYTIVISHKNSLVSSTQTFSLCISGLEPSNYTVDIGAPKTICEGGSTTLVATVNDTILPTTYQWRIAGNSAIISTQKSINVAPLQNTRYEVTAFSSSRISTASTQVTVISSPKVYAGKDTITAPEQPIRIGTPGRNGISYQWRVQGSTTIIGTASVVTIQPTKTTDFILRETNINQCYSEDTITVVVATPITAKARGNNVICFGMTTTLTSIGTGAGKINYTWLNIFGSTLGTGQNFSVSPRISTRYIVRVQDSLKRTVYDTIEVIVLHDKILPSVSTKRIICEDDILVATMPQFTSVVYSWKILSSGRILDSSSTSTTHTIRIQPTSQSKQLIIQASVRPIESNCSYSRVDTFDIVQKPRVDSLISSSACIGAITQYSVQETKGTQYYWSIASNGTSSTDRIIQGATAPKVDIRWASSGKKFLLLRCINAQGCASTTSFEINVKTTPVPVIQPQPQIHNTSWVTQVFSLQKVTRSTDILWSVDGGKIASGQSTPSITVIWDGIGTKQVRVSEKAHDGECIGSGTYTYLVSPQQSQGIQILSPTVLEMYPNPVRTILTTKTPIDDVTKPVEIRIVSLLGKECFYRVERSTESEFSTSIPVHDFISGTYIITITNGNKQVQSSFIKY